LCHYEELCGCICQVWMCPLTFLFYNRFQHMDAGHNTRNVLQNLLLCSCWSRGIGSEKRKENRARYGREGIFSSFFTAHMYSSLLPSHSLKVFRTSLLLMFGFPANCVCHLWGIGTDVCNF
jgi:hypothetical protein